MSATMTCTEVMCQLRVSRTYVWKEIRANRLPAALDTAVYPPVYRIPADAVRTLRPRHRRWTGAEDERLVAMLGHMPFAAIAKRLGRTETAVQLRTKRLGHSQRSEHYTANIAGRELGVESTTVCHWIRTGEMRPLPYRPPYGPRRCWLIAHEEIERFLRDRITNPHWRHQWRWQQMPRGYFRSFAQSIARRSDR